MEPRRPVGVSEPANVHRYRAVAGRSKRRKLRAPGVPVLRKGVQKKHQGSVIAVVTLGGRHGHVEACAVGCDVLVFPRTGKKKGCWVDSHGLEATRSPGLTCWKALGRPPQK